MGPVCSSIRTWLPTGTVVPGRGDCDLTHTTGSGLSGPFGLCGPPGWTVRGSKPGPSTTMKTQERGVARGGVDSDGDANAPRAFRIR
jgi:hypothetical protein